MELIFEKSRPGRGNDYLPPLDVPAVPLPEAFRRERPPRLPEIGESDASRHYQALSRRAFGVCDGFSPGGGVGNGQAVQDEVFGMASGHFRADTVS